MGLLVRSLPLHDGEIVTWSKLVNAIQWRGRRVGGRLFLTTRSLAFEPMRHERLLGGRSWSARLSHIAGADIVPASTLPLNARSLLRIRTNDGQDQLFGFNGKEKALLVITEALGGKERLPLPPVGAGTARRLPLFFMLFAASIVLAMVLAIVGAALHAGVVVAVIGGVLLLAMALTPGVLVRTRRRRGPD